MDSCRSEGEQDRCSKSRLQDRALCVSAAEIVMVKLYIQGPFARWLHVGGITAGQLDVSVACMMSVSSSRSHFHVHTWMVCRIRLVSGHCFEIERLTTGQHSVAEKDGVVNRLYTGFQKSCSAEAVPVFINPVSVAAGEWNWTGLFLGGGVLCWYVGSGVRVVEFAYWLFLKFASAVDPLWDRGDILLMVPWG